jgi:hypothetical protein
MSEFLCTQPKVHGAQNAGLNSTHKPSYQYIQKFKCEIIVERIINETNDWTAGNLTQFYLFILMFCFIEFSWPGNKKSKNEKDWKHLNEMYRHCLLQLESFESL